MRLWTGFYDLYQLSGSISVNFWINTRLFGRDITLSLGWESFRRYVANLGAHVCVETDPHKGILLLFKYKQRINCTLITATLLFSKSNTLGQWKGKDFFFLWIFVWTYTCSDHDTVDLISAGLMTCSSRLLNSFTIQVNWQRVWTHVCLNEWSKVNCCPNLTWCALYCSLLHEGDNKRTVVY